MPWRQVTVDATTRELAGYNPKRQSLTLANNGSGTIFFSQDPSNVATLGMPLGVGAIVTLVKAEGDEPEREIYGVSSAGAQDIRVEESVGELVPGGT